MRASGLRPSPALVMKTGRATGARGSARVALALAALSLCGLGWAGEAVSHAIIMESTPRHREEVAAPRRLVLRFNSRIEKRLSSTTLVGADRRSVPLPRAEPGAPPDTLAYALPDLAPGAYRVRWKVLAVDGHLTEGVLLFTVAGP